MTRTVVITSGGNRTVTLVAGLEVALTDDDGNELLTDDDQPLLVARRAVHRRTVAITED